MSTSIRRPVWRTKQSRHGQRANKRSTSNGGPLPPGLLARTSAGQPISSNGRWSRPSSRSRPSHLMLGRLADRPACPTYTDAPNRPLNRPPRPPVPPVNSENSTKPQINRLISIAITSPPIQTSRAEHQSPTGPPRSRPANFERSDDLHAPLVRLPRPRNMRRTRSCCESDTAGNERRKTEMMKESWKPDNRFQPSKLAYRQDL